MSSEIEGGFPPDGVEPIISTEEQLQITIGELHHTLETTVELHRKTEEQLQITIGELHHTLETTVELHRKTQAKLEATESQLETTEEINRQQTRELAIIQNKI